MPTPLTELALFFACCALAIIGGVFYLIFISRGRRRVDLNLKAWGINLSVKVQDGRDEQANQLLTRR